MSRLEVRVYDDENEDNAWQSGEHCVVSYVGAEGLFSTYRLKAAPLPLLDGGRLPMRSGAEVWQAAYSIRVFTAKGVVEASGPFPD